MRTFELERNTNETQIRVYINLDGRGVYENHTGVGFLDHMLDLFARHGRFDLKVECKGDTWVDDHHSVEDVGIALGTAIRNALGEKRGISRYGSMLLPMDEALILCAVDLSGRAVLGWKMEIPTQKIGSFDTELVKEFWLAMSRTLESSIHFQQLAGENSHHIVEGMFKAAGRALAQAVRIQADYADEIPSTKGTL